MKTLGVKTVRELCFCVATIVLLAPAGAIATESVEDAVANLKRAAQTDPKAAAELSHLQSTIEQLRTERAQLEKDKSAVETHREELEKQNAKLEENKRHLERNQTTLAGGLIGAVLAALVGMIGSLSKWRTSRMDKDLHRLQIIEKVVALQKQGVKPPEDISHRYPT